MAAALGVALVLVLIDIPAYYTSFMVITALLAQRRPKLGTTTLGAMIVLSVATLVWWNEPFRWAIASSVLLLVAHHALLEIRTPQEG